MVLSKYRQRDERGETLVELVVALAILGIAGVAVLTGMMLNVRASSANRNEAGGSSYARSAAEAIQNAIDASGAYASCANAIDNTSTGKYWSAANAIFSGSDLSNGYSVKILQVQSWVKPPSTAPPRWDVCDDKGIQRIQIQVTTLGTSSSKAVETLYVTLRKPCAAPGANPCS